MSSPKRVEFRPSLDTVQTYEVKLNICDDEDTTRPSERSSSVLETSRIDRVLTRTDSANSLRMQEFAHLWKRFADDEAPQILRALDIAHDGGLGSDGLQRLWETTEERARRICTAMLQVAFMCFNTYWIVRLDIEVLTGTSNTAFGHFGPNQFLLGDLVWHAVEQSLLQTGFVVEGGQLVVMMELLLLAGLMFRCILLAERAVNCRREWLRWQCVAWLFWTYLPLFGTFSSMKLLHFVSPRVMLTEFFLEVSFARQRFRSGQQMRAVWKLAAFAAFRGFCLMVGFDAFLVKFRVTSNVINSTDLSYGHVLVGAVFMFQVLGIVNLAFFVRKRLFVFIFGGEDGVMSTEEKAKEYLWNALLARRLFQTYPMCQYFIIMLSLDDYDIQMLMLKEAHSRESVL